MSEFERIVTMSPAFDKRHTDPKKNYGIHGVDLRMVLKGPRGATQFLLYTGWHLPHVESELELKPCGLSRPLPADRGYHWSEPRYEGQTSQKCDLLPGGICYYDGSGLNAEPLYHLLLTKGSEGVWKDLEDYYNDLDGRATEASESSVKTTGENHE